MPRYLPESDEYDEPGLDVLEDTDDCEDHDVAAEKWADRVAAAEVRAEIEAERRALGWSGTSFSTMRY